MYLDPSRGRGRAPTAHMGVGFYSLLCMLFVFSSGLQGVDTNFRI